MSLLTDEVRALIGMEGEPITFAEVVDESMLRRFVQGAMEVDPVHWDPRLADASRYGHVVAPPLFAAHARRRESGSPDPFDRFAEEPDADGAFTQGGWGGLPPIELPLKRMVNGGTEAEFYQLVQLGDRITARTKYLDISERQGKQGPFVVVKVLTTYTNQRGELLATITITPIFR